MSNENVNHPDHYTTGFATKKLECIDITRHLSFCRGNAFKYIWRAGKKGSIEKALEDCEKANWYMNDICSHHESDISETAKSMFRLIHQPCLDNMLDGLRYDVLRDIMENDKRFFNISLDCLKTHLNNMKENKK